MDEISVNNLVVRNIIGVDGWERSKRQPITLNVAVYTDINKAGASDLLQQSVNYGTISKECQAFSEQSTYLSVEQLANGLCAHLYQKFATVDRLRVQVAKPKALLHAKSAGVNVTCLRSDLPWLLQLQLPPAETPEHAFNDYVFINSLSVACIIGVNPWEREEEQMVVVHLRMYSQRVGQTSVQHNYRTVANMVQQHMQASSYKTVEALATAIARLCCVDCHVSRVWVRVEKPSALLFADAACITITRELKDFQVQPRKELTVSDAGEWTTCLIALGSNVGDRCGNIQRAVTMLNENENCLLVDTSHMNETAPMYVTDQAPFVNAACKCAYRGSADELLKLCKSIEQAVGRTETFRNGPRIVDLDIIFFGKLELKTNELTVPHPLMQERMFVLQPLCDIAPQFEHPVLKRTCQQLRAQLLRKMKRVGEQHEFQRVSQLGSTLIKWGMRTLIMGIINTTPDSFSDGGNLYPVTDGDGYGHEVLDVDFKQKLAEHVEKAVRCGCAILDVGGHSTRPNAPDVSVEEELRRLLPVIAYMRQVLNVQVPISVDTFRAVVAQRAVEAGATVVNDVSGGERDPLMRKTVAALGVPYIAMHMRGDAATMMSATDYSQQGDLINGIRVELYDRVRKALHAGVHRWNIIVDPGIGFAKTSQQSVELFKHMLELYTAVEHHGHDTFCDLPVGKQGVASQLRTCNLQSLQGFPVLVGPSRKAFIGQLTNQQDASKRVWGTAAVVAACVANGTDIIRVHDVSEMADVIRVSDAIYRA